MSLGTRISDLRKGKNITQDSLAEIMGVSSQAVSKWENDISCPDISMLPGLSDFFGVSIDMLSRGEENNQVYMLEPNRRKSLDQLVLRLRINSSDGDVVNINLPLTLLKAGMDIGLPFIQMGSGSVRDALKDIDLNSIFQFAENGLSGKILDIKSSDGDIVEIFIS